MSAPSPRRSLEDVIDQMLLVIPASETALRADLAKVKFSCGFTASEAMSLQWKRGAEALALGIGIPKLEWHHDVIDIWAPRVAS